MIITFPSATAIASCIENHPDLGGDSFLREKGIVALIVQLAQERFAHSEWSGCTAEETIEMGCKLIMLDIKTGENGWTGKPLPKIGMGLNSFSCHIYSQSLKHALIKCFKSQ